MAALCRCENRLIEGGLCAGCVLVDRGANRRRGAEEERAQIVAWLRASADRIERGLYPSPEAKP